MGAANPLATNLHRDFPPQSLVPFVSWWLFLLPEVLNRPQGTAVEF